MTHEPGSKQSSNFVYSTTVPIEGIYSSETSADLQQTRRLYIQGDRTLHNNRCENFKYYFKWSYCEFDSRSRGQTS
jgi:hypothetical protein